MNQHHRDLCIVLLGKTGSGKSASGNTILGDRRTFQEEFSPKPVTRICHSACAVVNGQNITVVDTVGFPDTTTGDKHLQRNMEQIFDFTEGFDVLLLVISPGNVFLWEVNKTVELIRKNLGERALKRTILLFTHGDQLENPLKDYLSGNKALRSKVIECSGGFHVFDNKHEDPGQVTKLLRKIKPVRMKNRYKKYTNQHYEDHRVLEEFEFVTREEIEELEIEEGGGGGGGGAVAKATAALTAVATATTAVATATTAVATATTAVATAITAVIDIILMIRKHFHDDYHDDFYDGF